MSTQLLITRKYRWR